MNIFEQLIEANKKKKELEDALAKVKATFEETIVREVEELKQITIEESLLREEVALTLEKNNESSVIINDSSISRQVRKTLKIDNPSILLASISANSKDIMALGIDIKELQGAFKHDIIVSDKKLVMDTVEKWENVEGKLLDGIVEQKTQFLTIKKI